jgi:hypothetical protein
MKSVGNRTVLESLDNGRRGEPPLKRHDEPVWRGWLRHAVGGNCRLRSAYLMRLLREVTGGSFDADQTSIKNGLPEAHIPRQIALTSRPRRP